MADEMQRIFNLLQNSTKAIADCDIWRYFLRTAAWHFKYPFNDQVLIFVQNSEATACASMSDWVNKTHRWVNKDAKPIALVRENGSQYYLDYVFDISDTNSFGKREIKLWKYDDRYESAVMQTLERSLGDIANANNIRDAIINASYSAVEDRKADYLHDLKYARRDSFLSGLDDVNLDLRFRQTAEASVAYMILQRMGLRADDVIDEYDLQYIRDFNTPETMSILGNAVSTIAEDALRDIAKTIHNEQKREKFAENKNSVYNESEKNKNDVQEERTDENDKRSNIHEGRRLSDTEPDSTDRGISVRQIRNDAEDVSEKTASDPVLPADDERRTSETLGGDRQDNNTAGTDNSIADGGSGECERGTESDRPAQMDRFDEQLSPFGGGNRVIRNGVQLSIFDMVLPSEAEQKEYIMKAEQVQGSAFSMPKLSEVKSITLKKVGAFYEIYGSAAEKAAEILDLTLTPKVIDGENLSMVGFPSHIVEKYTKVLNENGYLVGFLEDNKEQDVADSGDDVFIKTDSDTETDVLEADNENAYEFEYRLLSRLKQDCEYFLGAGNRYEGHLWAGNVQYQISKMRELYAMLPEKPEWLSEQDIDRYAENMLVFRHRTNDKQKAEDMYDEYITVIVSKVLNYERYINACHNSDKENARLECDAAVKRAVLDLFKAGNIELCKLYFDMPEFYKKVHEYSFEQTYDVLIKNSDLPVFNSKAEITKDMYLIDTADVFVVPRNKGTLVTIDITPSEELFQRLAENGLKRTEESENRILYDTDGGTWNRIVIPDKWGHKFNNIEAFKFMTETEYAVMTEISEMFIPKEAEMDAPITDEQEQNAPDTNLTALQQKAVDIAKKYENLSMQEKINIIAQSFCATTGKIETHPCTGKWRGTSDISIKFDNGTSFFIGNAATPKAKTVKVQKTYIDACFTRYNPEIISAEKEAAIYALRKREIRDNAIAEQKGLKPYTLLNVEFNDGTYDKSGRNMGWYYVTIAVDGKIYSHIETGLNYDISSGKVSEMPTRKDYFVAGALKETDVDYVFNNVGYSSASALYSLPISDEVRERAENTLAERIAETDSAEKISIIAEQTQEQPELPPPNIPKPQPVQNTVIYPEIPMSECHNFTITDNELGYGTASEKYAANIAAIRTLKQVETEHRLATPEEQEILSRYVGWGGLADCFDEKHSKYNELKSLLTDDEYEQARASVLTSHYTPPVVIRAMYKAMENMGFKQGNILEPSCGIGNFMGLMPESISDSKIYGIEIDSITGRIAQQLYQKNSVAIQGFEDSTLPDSFFDVAIGNVPFGNFKVLEKKYDKHNFLIHDFFFAKTLDKVRPGGIIAFITSSGTMDKQNSKVRKYIAQRADLVGAIRLPNNTFKKNAGTEVTADILFLQKRDRITDIEPDWVHVGQHETGHPINQYFLDNPDMVLGELVEESGQYGMQLNCKAYGDADLEELLNEAIQNIHAQITEYEIDDISDDNGISIPADPDVKNFSYTIVDGDIYFRENSIMTKVELNATAQSRIRGMIELRDCVRTLIEYQTLDFPDYEIKKQQYKLNNLYDNFTKKYGLINSRGNEMAFSSDSSYFLLCSLEVLNDKRELERKADMFTKRTIGAKKEITSVNTASEALAVSIGEKAKVDMEFMSSLTGKTEQELFEDLKGVIFLNPEYISENDGRNKYLPADEYLSGNVRKKLEVAQRNAEINPDAYTVNVEALTAVQPKDLTASEITVRLGTTWIPVEYIKQFTFELLNPSLSARREIDIYYSKLTGNWNVSGKSSDKGNVKINNTYGTHRANALKIIEDTLNLRDVRIFDYKENENGNRVPVLNHKETTIAQQKQEAIKAAFDNWIWKDPQRRETLVKMYNEKLNNIRTREYDGSHITFSGMNPEEHLRKHQIDAVARIMYGGNSLLAHVVGAGKTWAMVAAAMESKRLGLCNKPLFVVPNSLTEQWASAFLQLYPAANILVTTKKDFEMKNRKKFCGRIATGDYDAIIMGHSQFEKIPMSALRQHQILSRQLQEIMEGIAEAKENNAERFTIKQMERTKRSIQAKIKKLNNQNRKDDVITFEELGVDRLFVDEAHSYKNLFLVTKMRNVGGIAQTDAQKSSDMFMKCRYLDEITGNKGVIFATGTPISNSMVELYTMQRYLQYDMLAEHDLQHFDAWASTYGETVTAIELAPEGTGYRAKTRFAKFYNIPELMNMFREVADIQTADMLNLPVPEAEYHNISVEPTEMQKQMVAELGERAENVRKGGVDPTIDNMLKITNDGRKLALDQRLMNDMLPDKDGTKVSTCANNVFDIWQKTSDFKGTQLVFCDSSTPKKDGTFNVYDDIRSKLIDKGIPENEIAFIHDADTEVRKKELFAKVMKGDVRVLLGSTQKLGTGTNVQKLLYASHDLDCPWRPSDLEQRAGRIIRQGNENKTVHLYRYVTKDTFDAYSYQLVENKQKFISQIMTSKSPVRSAEDIDETALSYAEIKALATGNPHIKEKMELDTDVARLKLLKSSFMSEIYELEDKVIKFYPQQIQRLTEQIAGAEKDIACVNQYPKIEDKFYPMTIDGTVYAEKDKAGNALIERCKTMTSTDPVIIGKYRGFTMILSFQAFEHKLTLQNSRSYTISLGDDVFGNIQRVDNALANIPKLKAECEQKLVETKKQFEIAKADSKREFPREAELTEKQKRLAELDSLLNIDKKGNDGMVLDMPDETLQKQHSYDMER